MIDQTQARHKYPNIPDNLLMALYAYVERRQAVGHFLTCVLSNDLFGAMQRADSQSQAALKEIVEFIFNYMPTKCYGDTQAVRAWLTRPHNPCGEMSLKTGFDMRGQPTTYLG